MKIIPTLAELCKFIGRDLGYASDEVLIVVSNIDDIFGVIASKGIKEVIVTRLQMHMIVMFYLANLTSVKSEKRDKWLEQINWRAWAILSEGTIKKFLGIKLILEKRNDQI